MKVSIITPFYNGNKYMQAYVDMIEANIFHLAEGDELEVILVNDSPEVTVELPASFSSVAKVLTMASNGGVHAARVRGLAEASGDFVIFLDQDDKLAKDAVGKHLYFWRKGGGSGSESEVANHIQVSNAILSQKAWQDFVYRTAYHKGLGADLKTNPRVGTQIISPGQCLLPTSIIPWQWKSNICQKNGSDDYYLWLLLLGSGASFEYIDEPLYIHSYTGENLSSDTSVTDDSTLEFLQYLRSDGSLTPKECDMLEFTTKFKASFRAASRLGKLALAAAHPQAMICNLNFKIRTKTSYGFNR